MWIFRGSQPRSHSWVSSEHQFQQLYTQLVHNRQSDNWLKQFMELSFVHFKPMKCSSSFITLVTLKLRPMTLTNFHMFGHILERDNFLTSRANWSLVGTLMISQLFCFLLWDVTIITIVQLFTSMLFLLVFPKSCQWFQGDRTELANKTLSLFRLSNVDNYDPIMFAVYNLWLLWSISYWNKGL